VIMTEFGNVMTSPLLRYSAGGPYGRLADSVAKATAAAYRRGGGSPPSVVADVVSRAVAAKKPKTRYAAGKWARSLMFIRNCFGDRVFDRVIMSRFG
jgi:hypothetical protein